MFPVNVSPDMAMYTLLINQGYDPTFALCEFIDNAIHAHTSNGTVHAKQLRIKLKFYSNEYHTPELRNSIVIEDDGPGIPKDALQRALKPAKPPASKGLSEFGIGMKSAAVWFADEWQLDTWPEEEEMHLRSVFNLSKLLDQGKDTIEVEEERVETGKRGTHISLRQLRKDLNQAGYDLICTGLSEIYQRFISGDVPQLELLTSFNGTERRLQFENPPPSPLVSQTHVKREKQTVAIGEEITWKVNVDFIFQGHPVKGIVQLRDVGSYRNNPGLVLFRHNRVICGTTQKRYIPLALYKTSNKARAMRVYGELDLNESPVSFTKDRFTFEDDDFIEALTTNVEFLPKLLAQADNYRKNVSVEENPTVEEGVGATSGNQSGSSGSGSRSEDDENKGGKPIPGSAGEKITGTSSAAEGTFTESSSGTGSHGAQTGQESSGGARPTPPKSDKRIKYSQAVDSRLDKLESSKLKQLYYSLITISLTQHSAMMCVAAWVFFESLARRAGSDPKNPFPDYFNTRMNGEWRIAKEVKKSYSFSLKRIADEGNCAKHCAYAFPADSRQLANDFELLEPVILKALDEAIALSASAQE